MIRWALAALLLVARPGAAVAAPRAPAAPDFPTGVLPVLTAAGCNSGACHGAAVGQGGFRLSLLGYNPEADHASIAREFEGRRIDSAAPAESLILRKASLQGPHGGGLRLPAGSPGYERVRAWIAAGAPFGGARRIRRVVVSPQDAALPRPGASVALRVAAEYGDGRREDVTRLALFTANDEALAAVTPEGRVTARGRGIASVMVRYLGQVAAVRVAVPYPAAEATRRALAAFPVRGAIDRALRGDLVGLNLPPSPAATEAELLRRVTLDLTGTLPTAEETRDYLTPDASAELPSSSSNSSSIQTRGVRIRTSGPSTLNAQPSTPYDRRVDRLLASPAFVDYWTYKLGDLLLLDSKRLGEGPARAYREWLREQVAQNTPLDRLVAALLTAEGDVARVGPANFRRTSADPRDMGEFVSRAFLGIRVQCARCHSHPFDRWTQDDYYAWAAFFARSDYNGRSVILIRGEVQHPKTGKPVPPRPLGGWENPGRGNEEMRKWGNVPVGPAISSFPHFLISSEEDPRLVLAGWLAGPGNDRFAAAMANRVWKELMGRGIVEPVDDLRASNPPLSPALLAAVTGEFRRGGFDLRRLVRAIVTSSAYRTSSRPLGANRLDDRLFSHAALRPLAGPVLADAIAQVTGVADRYPGQPDGTRAVQLLDARVPSAALDTFGRCRREASCEVTTQGGGLAQALHLINDAALQEKVRAGIVAQLIAGNQSPREIVEELYLRALSRFPSEREREHWESVLAPPAGRREAAEDLLWALLNSREFAYNH